MTYLPYVEYVMPSPLPPAKGFWKNVARVCNGNSVQTDRIWCAIKENLAENKRRYKINLEKCLPFQQKAFSLLVSEYARLHATLTLNIDELRALEPTQFEDEIARMFTRLGYDVTQTSYSNDYGRDVIMLKDGKKYLVECKCYAVGGSSGRPVLQKLHSAMVTDGADGGFFVTTGGFSDPAREFAKANKIELIGPDALVRLMAESKPGKNSTEYKAACHHCGELVSHDLRELSRSVKCCNGHEVDTILTIKEVLGCHPTSRWAEDTMFERTKSLLAPYGWSNLIGGHNWHLSKQDLRQLFNDVRAQTRCEENDVSDRIITEMQETEKAKLDAKRAAKRDANRPGSMTDWNEKTGYGRVEK